MYQKSILNQIKKNLTIEMTQYSEEDVVYKVCQIIIDIVDENRVSSITDVLRHLLVFLIQGSELKDITENIEKYVDQSFIRIELCKRVRNLEVKYGSYIEPEYFLDPVRMTVINSDVSKVLDSSKKMNPPYYNWFIDISDPVMFQIKRYCAVEEHPFFSLVRFPTESLIYVLPHENEYIVMVGRRWIFMKDHYLTDMRKLRLGFADSVV